MGDTSIRVSDELADELWDRKQRGDTYEDVIWRLMEQADADAGTEVVAPAEDDIADTGSSTESARETDTRSVPEDAAAGEDVEEALAGWSHGRGRNEKEASRKVAVAALEWLRGAELDAVSKSDVPLNAFAEMDEFDRDTDTLWTQVVRESWQHAADKGYIEQPHSRAYRWVGESDA